MGAAEADSCPQPAPPDDDDPPPRRPACYVSARARPRWCSGCRTGRCTRAWTSSARRLPLSPPTGTGPPRRPTAGPDASIQPRDADPHGVADESGLELVGLVAVVDPPRSAAADVVCPVRSAGLRLVPHHPATTRTPPPRVRYVLFTPAPAWARRHRRRSSPPGCPTARSRRRRGLRRYPSGAEPPRSWRRCVPRRGRRHDRRRRQRRARPAGADIGVAMGAAAPRSPGRRPTSCSPTTTCHLVAAVEEGRRSTPTSGGSCATPSPAGSPRCRHAGRPVPGPAVPLLPGPDPVDQPAHPRLPGVAFGGEPGSRRDAAGPRPRLSSRCWAMDSPAPDPAVAGALISAVSLAAGFLAPDAAHLQTWVFLTLDSPAPRRGARDPRTPPGRAPGGRTGASRRRCWVPPRSRCSRSPGRRCATCSSTRALTPADAVVVTGLAALPARGAPRVQRGLAAPGGAETHRTRVLTSESTSSSSSPPAEGERPSAHGRPRTAEDVREGREAEDQHQQHDLRADASRSRRLPEERHPPDRPGRAPAGERVGHLPAGRRRRKRRRRRRRAAPAPGARPRLQPPPTSTATKAAIDATASVGPEHAERPAEQRRGRPAAAAAAARRARRRSAARRRARAPAACRCRCRGRAPAAPRWRAGSCPPVSAHSANGASSATLSVRW